MLPNVIIVGAPKSGTTSLHRWLTDHPDVAGPSRKETAYFVDPDSHTFRPEANYRDHGLSGYERYFQSPKAGHARTVLEVAPDYMSQRTALEVLPSLPGEPEFVFVLREPAAQIHSLYLYLKHNWQYVPKHMGFERFVELARERSPELGNHELAQNAIANARYVELIDKWVARAGAERVRVYLFEDLVADNRVFMQRLCLDLGIDPAFYDQYRFPRANETYRVRSTLLQSSNVAIRSKLPKGRIYNALRWLYRRLNTASKPPVSSVEDRRVLDTLRAEFREPNRRLAERYQLDLSAWRNHAD